VKVSLVTAAALVLSSNKRTAAWAVARARLQLGKGVRDREPASSEQLRSNNAQTPLKTGHHQGPEDEARHYERQPCTVCKTSIPGSNPGGASNIIKKNAPLVPWRHNQVLAKCSQATSAEIVHQFVSI
jgi:hypothetical protein